MNACNMGNWNSVSIFRSTELAKIGANISVKTNLIKRDLCDYDEHHDCRCEHGDTKIYLLQISVQINNNVF